jgi:hypothetical protein
MTFLRFLCAHAGLAINGRRQRAILIENQRNAPAALPIAPRLHHGL